MAKESGSQRKLPRNSQNTPRTRNLNSHGIEDVCLKADYTKDQSIP